MRLLSALPSTLSTISFLIDCETRLIVHNLDDGSPPAQLRASGTEAVTRRNSSRQLCQADVEGDDAAATTTLQSGENDALNEGNGALEGQGRHKQRPPALSNAVAIAEGSAARLCTD